MRAMTVPSFFSTEVFNGCVQGIKDNTLKRKFIGIGGAVTEAASKYTSLANVGKLFSYPIDSGGNEDVIVGGVTKREMKILYSYYMVGSGMPARRFYDLLISSAPNGICPLCGAGYAITLDHYLPKSKFPMFSVLPQNLVPACRDCNTGKLAVVAGTAGDQSLHPYFDHDEFINIQWLFANVEQSVPPVVNYFARAPSSWPEANQRRVAAHFESLKLGPRFSVLAADELGSLRPMLVDFVAGTGAAAVKDYLSARARAESTSNLNSWKTAMFQALSDDQWYCTRGFRL